MMSRMTSPFSVDDAFTVGVSFDLLGGYLLGRGLLASPLVGRLNLGAIPTNHIQWDQPHEGNLFDHLYARRAFQRAIEAIAS